MPERMSDEMMSYLRLHEAVAKTNSCNDQPPLSDLTKLMNILATLPADGSMERLSESQYTEILRLAQNEISKR